MTKATLHLAYVWDCDLCGRENFERSIVAEMSPEELQELRDEHGVEEFETGDFVSRPEEVTCKVCGATFETDSEGEE